MRHAAHEQGTLTPEGVAGVKSVAERLFEVLASNRLKVDSFYMTPSLEATATAWRLRDELQREARRLLNPPLGPRKGEPVPPSPPPGRLPVDPVPDAYYDWTQLKAPLGAIVATLCGSDKSPIDDTSAGLLVGNDPLVGWVADRMLGHTLGFDRGEIACLRRRGAGGAWKLEWTITPDDRPAEAPLREKIRSKMDTAKVLGGVIVALLTFLVQSFFRDGVPSAASVVALGCFAAAAWLYLAALFFYDSLLMPPRWWGSRVQATRQGRGWRLAPGSRARWLVRRPPSSTARVLVQNMVRVWNRVFIPATALVGIGVIVLIGDVAGRSAHRPGGDTDLGWSAVGITVASALALAAWTFRSRPRLGSQD